MPPRRSTVGVEVGTPVQTGRTKRSAPNTSPQSSVRPTKRAKRNQATEEIHDDTKPNQAEGDKEQGEGVIEDVIQVSDQTVGLEGEAELEAWQDFVMDHYEVVEQLPLELHRNYRLLRELDDECAAQTEKLHSLIREYACSRLKRPIKPLQARKENGQGGDQQAEQAENIVNPETEKPDPETIEDQPRHSSVETEAVEEVEERPPNRPNDITVFESFESIPPPAPPPVDEELHASTDLGLPVPDGRGGLLLPAKDEDTVHERLPFPSTKGLGEDERSHGLGKTRDERANLLAEIGKLSREIVRNGEEKVAVAVGAYNAIDRHIRALDSALSVQEASILLGLRPDTIPSTAVDTSLNLAADPNVQDEGFAIGVAGGRARKKGKNARKAVEAEVPKLGRAGVPYIDLTGVEIGPNEPVYCFCQQVSYGEMVGCENDACPYEWFHLHCLGLLTAPTGKWYCPDCKPRPGGGMGGGGALKAGVASGKKRSKARR